MNRWKKILSVILCAGMIGGSVLSVSAKDWHGKIEIAPDQGEEIILKGTATIENEIHVKNNRILLDGYTLTIQPGGSLMEFGTGNTPTVISGGTINNYGICTGFSLEKGTVLNNYGISQNISGEGTVKNLLAGNLSIDSSGSKGSTLSVSAGSEDFYNIDTSSLVYQWQRSDSEKGSYTNISGATGTSYTLSTADGGKYVRVRVTDGARTNKHEGSVESNACKVAKIGAKLSGSSITIGKGEEKNLTATLTDNTDGEPLSGRSVTLLLEDKTYTAKTDSEGVATFKASSIKMAELDAQTYDLKYSFSGDSSTNAVAETDAAKLTVELKAHKITVKKAKNGKVTVAEKSAKEGEFVAVTTEPDEGYELSSLKANGKKIDDGTLEMPNEAVTLEAKFTKIKCKIKVTASPKKGGTVSGGKTVSYGDSITLKAKAKSGYRFLRWVEGENDTAVSTSATWKIDKVTDSHTYKAVFEKVPAATRTTVARTAATSATTANAVRTGDTAPVGSLVILMAAAVIGMTFGIRKLEMHKKEK